MDIKEVVETLRKYIGKQITIDNIVGNSEEIVEGTLTSVDDTGVVVGEKSYAFVGRGCAIRVIFAEEDRAMLYDNCYVIPFYYHARSRNAVAEKMRQSFGEEYVKKFLETLLCS